MAVERGRISTLEVNNGGGYQPVGRLLDPTFNLEISDMDATTHDSGAWTESLYNRGTATIEAPCLADEADQGQRDSVTAALNQTTVTLRWRLKGAASGNLEYTASALVTAAGQEGPNDDPGKLNLSYKITGAVTEATQA